MSPADIAKTLLAQAATLVAGAPTMPVAMPEQPFTPPDDGRYLEVMLFLNKPAWEGLADGVIPQGLLQVTVVWAANLGVTAPLAAAENVMAQFPKGLILRSDSGRAGIKIGQAYAGSPIKDNNRLLVVVTIPWTAFAI